MALRTRNLTWRLLPVTALLYACSSSSPNEVRPAGAEGGAAGDENGGTAGDENGGTAGDENAGTAGDENGGAAGSEKGGATGPTALPTVVTTLAGLPAALALSGKNLYFTVLPSDLGNDGKVQSVSTDGGAISTLASGLRSPGAIAVSGTDVYWADSETVFPDYGDVMAVPTAGGATREVARSDTRTRLVLAGESLYGLTFDDESVTSFPLTGAPSAGTVVYPPSSPYAVAALDTDGSSLFFFSNGVAQAQEVGKEPSTDIDLFKVSVAGGEVVDLAPNATSGSSGFDSLVDDSTTLFWSDSGSGGVYSLPKSGGTPKLLTTFQSGSAPVQIVLDGTTIYALSFYALYKFPKAGGTPVTLASVSGASSDRYLGSGSELSLAVDESNVYWTYFGHGQILKIAK